jgi:hypothetical protein
MKTKTVLAAATLALLSACTLLAQDADHSWSKTYPVSGKPTLDFETTDASVDFRPCDCHEVRIHIELVGQKMSDFRLEEGQSGDEVHFLFKELPHMGVHIEWHREQTRITVETPAQLTLQAKTSDGHVTLSGLQGTLGLTTGDGNVTVDGLFHALALHTSDGRLELSLRSGTKLTEASTIQTSDGSVAIHLPSNFAADLNVHSSDGHVDCALPLTLDHYQSSGSEGHELHGKLNGGGTPLSIRTSDGNVKIDQI